VAMSAILGIHRRVRGRTVYQVQCSGCLRKYVTASPRVTIVKRAHCIECRPGNNQYTAACYPASAGPAFTSWE
jgi:hypothetical protein